MSSRAATTQETSPEQTGRPGQLPLQSVVAGRYLVLSVLGSGGMGTVYRARHQATRREVALKVLHASLHDRPRALRRFEREAQALAEVTHPNIAPTLDAGVDAVTGVRYQTSALLEGESLRELVRREAPLATEHALRLIIPVLSALEAVHAAGIVHRDVKPENIVVSEGVGGPHPWLLDFGICTRDDGDTLDAPGDALVGTPAYMAPEQAAGDVAVDARADVWAVGAVLHELLTGAPPFHDPMPGRRLARVLSEDAPPVATLRPDLPPALAACVDRALARDRTKRYASARAFADALLQAADTPSLAVCAASPRSSPDASWMRGASLLAVIAVIAVTWAIVARRVRRAEAPRASLAARLDAPPHHTTAGADSGGRRARAHGGRSRHREDDASHRA